MAQPASPSALAFVASIDHEAADEELEARAAKWRKKHPQVDVEQDALSKLGIEPADLAALSIPEIEEAIGLPCSPNLLARRAEALLHMQEQVGRVQTGHIRRFFPAPDAPCQLKARPKKANASRFFPVMQ